MIKEKEMSKAKRCLLPTLSILSSVFIIFATVYAHGIKPYLEAQVNNEFSFPVLFYLIVFSAIMLIGFVVKRISDKKKQCNFNS